MGDFFWTVPPWAISPLSLANTGRFYQKSADALPTAWTHYHWVGHITIGLDPLPTAWTHYQQHGHITNSMDSLPVFFCGLLTSIFFGKTSADPFILFPLLIS